MSFRGIVAPLGLTAEASNASAVEPRFKTQGEQAYQRDQARRQARLNVFMAARPDMQAYRGASAADIGAPQYGPSFRQSGLRGFNALSTGTAAELKAFVAAVRAATAKLEDAQPGMFMSWFQKSVVGADSTVAAGKEDLRQQKKLLALAESAYSAFMASGDEAAAQSWLAKAKSGRWDDVKAGVEAGNQMSAGAFVDQVVVQTAKDAGAAAAEAGGRALTVLKYLPYIAVGAAVIYGGIFVWRRSQANKARALASLSVSPRRRRRRTRRSR